LTRRGFLAERELGGQHDTKGSSAGTGLHATFRLRQSGLILTSSVVSSVIWGSGADRARYVRTRWIL